MVFCVIASCSFRELHSAVDEEFYGRAAKILFLWLVWDESGDFSKSQESKTNLHGSQMKESCQFRMDTYIIKNF